MKRCSRTGQLSFPICEMGSSSRFPEEPRGDNGVESEEVEALPFSFGADRAGEAAGWGEGWRTDC